MTPSKLEQDAINAIRFLAADGVQKANSGHPGLPMGAAAIAYTIWTRHLSHNPANPHWFNRDRFILSGGHGSMLLYALLYLTGYDLSLDELKSFRQWGSRTPGHPEVGLTPGVETTTGPLGQGFANGVGMAIAETHLAAKFNLPEHQIINHYTYAIVTDGDLMEGVTSEAASLAGHLQLGKLIYLYDDNHISIDGSTDLAFTEDRGKRFEAYGWHVQYVADGNDVEEIDRAIKIAKNDLRPSLICCRTQIGYGLPTRQNTAKAHGEPPGEEELLAAKHALGWQESPSFFVPEEVLSFYRQALPKGAVSESNWQRQMAAYQTTSPELHAELTRRIDGKLPKDWDKDIITFAPDSKGMATRAASGKVLNSLAPNLPELLGGSADLTPSTLTYLTNLGDFQKDTPTGRNFHYGVREHGMGSILNGMALHGGILPFGATFLVFSDYMRPTLRLAALSHVPTIFVFTHDSIGLGEDGPTHQPVEHLAALRAIPNLTVIRPADANEVAEAWRTAILNRHGPTTLIFSRQAIPTLDRTVYSPANNLSKGAYVLADLGKKPQLILMASGTEVSLITKAGELLAAEGISVRLVSFPSWELFSAQDKTYRDSVLLPNLTKRIAVEAGIRQGWEQWIGDEGLFIGMSEFGASAPAPILYEKFGITVEHIMQAAHQLLS